MLQTQYEVAVCNAGETEYQPVCNEQGEPIGLSKSFRVAARAMRTFTRAARDAGSRVRVTERQVFSPDGVFEKAYRINEVQVDVPEAEATAPPSKPSEEEIEAQKAEKAAAKAAKKAAKREEKAKARISKKAAAAEAARKAVQDASKEPEPEPEQTEAVNESDPLEDEGQDA